MHSIFGEYGVFLNRVVALPNDLSSCRARFPAWVDPLSALPRVHKTLAMSDSYNHAGTEVHVCSVRKR